MKETGIIFSGDHPLKVLDGSKTQTRRTWGLDYINKDPGKWYYTEYVYTKSGYCHVFNSSDNDTAFIKCPYGNAGDLLWGKETWSPCPDHRPVPYPERSPAIWYRADNDRPTWATQSWRSSMFMPRKYSRISKIIKDIRPERLHEITEGDVLAEGVTAHPELNSDGWRTTVDDYKDLWDSLNAKRGWPWKNNIWVWRICF